MGGLDVLVAVLLLICIWVLLPARWMPVDVIGTLVAMGFAASGIGFLSAQPWAPRVGKWVAGVALLIGALLAGALAITAGHISGLYGPVGFGGSIILAAVAALIVPYFVVFPAAQLYILLRAEPASTAVSASADSDSDPGSDSDSDSDSDPKEEE